MRKSKIILIAIITMICVFGFRDKVSAEEYPTYECIYPLSPTGVGCKVTVTGNTVNSNGFSIKYNCSPNASGIEASKNMKYTFFKNSEGNPVCPPICTNVKLGQKKYSGSWAIGNRCSTGYRKVEATSDSTTKIPDSYTKPSNTKTCTVFADGAIVFKINYNYDNKSYTLEKFNSASRCLVQNAENQLKEKIDEYFAKYENNLDDECDTINVTLFSKQGSTLCTLFTNRSGGTGAPEIETEGDVSADNLLHDENTESNPELITGDPLDCQTLKDTNTYKIIRSIFTWIQIIAPIMLVIFGVLDFSKAVLAGDADAMKKSQSAFIKRIIIVAAIILLPFIMDLLISLLDGALGNDICTLD